MSLKRTLLVGLGIAVATVTLDNYISGNVYADEKQAQKQEEVKKEQKSLEEQIKAVPFMELYNKTKPEALKHYMVAAKIYREWVKNKPEDKTFEQWLEMGDEKIGKSAVNELKDAIKIDPKSPILYYQLAQLYEVNGEIDLAVENAKKAIELENRFIQVYGVLGRLYKTRKEYDKAIDMFEKQLELDPNYKYREFILRDIQECRQKLKEK